MQNLEKQVSQIFKMLEKTEDRQIKDESQLTDLAKGVEFINQKFDEYEKDRQEKDEIIATLQNELKSASMEVAPYNIREKVFKSKKNLKAKNISIAECLTRYRMSVLNEAREKYGFKNLWTYDRRILYEDISDEQKIKIYYD